MISVLIADDQELVREGLRMMLEAEPDLRVAGEAANGQQALTQARRLDPDVVLMDVRMPELDGIEAATQLVRSGSRARILMLTTFNLDEYVYRAMKAVAEGLSNAEIAARLYLSEATVKSHVARVLAKLDLRDRVQIAVFAYESGIVRPGRRERA